MNLMTFSLQSEHDALLESTLGHANPLESAIYAKSHPKRHAFSSDLQHPPSPEAMLQRTNDTGSATVLAASFSKNGRKN
ncbi:unnamed protein product [Nezara viridula]|uniref:Uncharacterized protein n=1 Tax=Nezara viridula TaxID=85310 RepID=A0A9P0MVB7_NEZVI|nr:unnamed protein product [Nezara viridula]